MNEPALSTIDLGHVQLRAATWASGTERSAIPDVVMLHDGLGSISQWRSVPGEIAATTGKTVMAYERAGHGESLPTPSGPWPADWLDREADVLEQVLAGSGAEHPILVGHSDGGSTALLYATKPTSCARAVLALAPHSWVEQICFDSIVGMRENPQVMVSGLARHHVDSAALFEAWSGVWVSDEFRDWDIRPRLGAITVPTVIAQGADDAYASEDQAVLTSGAVGKNSAAMIVPGVGHIMHHDDAQIVIDLIANFIRRHG